MADLKKFAEDLVNLTVKEVNELAEILKDEHGIEPAIVIGDCKSFKLALGKYAFISCDYIPKEYLKKLLESNISKKDREIISKYINK